MPYIVKSSLDIGGKIVPWNEKEVEKLIKEKEEKLDKVEEPKVQEAIEETVEAVEEVEEVEKQTIQEEEKPQTEFKAKSKRKEKAGEN